MDNIKLCCGNGKYHTDRTRPLSTLVWDEITALVDRPQDVEKSKAQWVIPSTLLDRLAKNQEVKGEYWMLWADIDHAPPSISKLAQILEVILEGCRFEVYTTNSATEDNQKSRILIPLDKPLTPLQWLHSQGILNDRLKEASITPDRSSERLAQLCFLPNEGEYYDSQSNRAGPCFGPLAAFSEELTAMQESIEGKGLAIAESKRQAELKRSERLTQGFKSPIEAFNASYLVEEILEQAGYAQRGDTFRHPNSESRSFSASVKDRRVHTLSSADLLWTGGGGGGAHDAFSAFTMLWHNGNQSAAIKDVCKNWLNGWEEENKMRNNLEQFVVVAAPNHSAQEQDLTEAPTTRSLLPPPANKKPFKLTSIGELMKQPPPLKWLIKGYLPPEGLGFLIAAPATGKTFLAIDWFCHIACGLPWWGKSVKQGGVVVIAGEGHHGLRRRLKAWGINQGIVMDNKPIVVSDVAASLTDKASVEAVMDAIDLSLAQLESVDIIVIDTLHRNIAGDENSSEDMAVYFNHLDHLRAEYGCFILTVHHTGHGEQGRARGSSSIKAAIDVEYIISKSGDVAKVSCEKMKDGEKPKNFDFTLPEVTIPTWLDDDGNPETSVVVAVSEAEASSWKEKNLSDQIMIAFEALCILTVEAEVEEAKAAATGVGAGEMKEKKEKKIENTAWKHQAFIKLTHDNEDSKQKAFNRGKNALIKAGYVDVESNHYWIKALSLSHQTSTILNRVSGALSANKIMY